MVLLALHKNREAEHMTQKAHRFIVSVTSVVSSLCCPLCASGSKDLHIQGRSTLTDLHI
jgi:hypothetical protein